MQQITLSSALFALFLSTTCAQAADIKTLDDSHFGSVAVLSGKIEYGDEQKWFAIPEEKRRHLDYVTLSGPGGNVEAAIKIGMDVRESKIKTIVLDGNSCESACGIIWIAGVYRIILKDGFVGFHAAFDISKGPQFESSSANAQIGAYYAAMGLNYAAIGYLTSAPSSSMLYLKEEDRIMYGIDFEQSKLPLKYYAGTLDPYLHLDAATVDAFQNAATHKSPVKPLDFSGSCTGGLNSIC